MVSFYCDLQRGRGESVLHRIYLLFVYELRWEVRLGLYNDLDLLIPREMRSDDEGRKERKE